MRDLLASDAPSAALAVDYFVYRVTREAGSLAAAMSGINGIVFTAGIGEHASAIRERVCRNLAWLGLDFDEQANAAGRGLLSRPSSKVEAWVIPTDEELMIARHTLAALRKPTDAGADR
jgi:acetate kinase